MNLQINFKVKDYKENISGKKVLVTRGLGFVGHILVKALIEKHQLKLTLVGQLDEAFDRKIIQDKQDFIEVKKALPQESLHALLTNYDIGLALEDFNEDFNRDICLTNKIWAYFQAGFYILATKTKAQIEFMKQNAGHGELMTFEKEQLNLIVHNLTQEKHTIRSEQKKRFLRAKAYSFEKEMEPLKAMIA